MDHEISEENLNWLETVAEDQIERDIENLVCFLSQSDQDLAEVTENKTIDFSNLSKADLLYLTLFGTDENSRIARYILKDKYHESQKNRKNEILNCLINEQI